MMNGRLRPILVALAILCSGCPRPLWLPDRNLREYVHEQEVIGIWNLSAESLDLLTRDGFKTNPSHQYRIQFLPDGVCAFQSVVDIVGDTDVIREYYDVKGKWKLEHDTTGNSNIKKKNTLRMALTLPDGEYSYYLNFDKQDGTLVLWDFYGDPDSWEFMEYKRAK